MPEWEGLVARAEASPVTMVIGASDRGKTTLVTTLANALSARHSVAVVDADLGQSEIGPPTTIGLGRVRAPLRRLGEAEVVGLHFVGTTSPAGNLLGALVGARRMLDRARALGFTRVVIDTSGLVAGGLGRTLKRAKIDLVDAALVICLEHGDECGHIVAAYAGAERPVVLRLPASPVVRPRSADERRRHRQERLQAYFAGARSVALSLDRVTVRGLGGEPLDRHHRPVISSWRWPAWRIGRGPRSASGSSAGSTRAPVCSASTRTSPRPRSSRS